MKILTLPPSDGLQIALRVLRTRRWSMLATVLVVLGLMGVYLLVSGRTFTASTSLQIVPIGSESTASVKNGASSVDMTTEVDLVRSGETSRRTAEKIGEGLEAPDLMDGIGVKADPLGTVITISWTDEAPERAIRVVNAQAESYLEVRQEFASARAAAVMETLDEEITAKTAELHSLGAEGAGQAARRAAIEASINSLYARRAALLGIEAPAGRVITSPAASDLEVGPSRRLYLLSAAALGLVTSLVVAIIRERTDHSVRGPGHLAQIIAAPVWEADMSGAGDIRWYGAANLAILVGRDRGTPGLVIGSTEKETPFILKAFASAQGEVRPDRGLVLIDLDGPRAELIRELAEVQHVIIAPNRGMTKEEVRQLADQIDLSGCELIGAFYLQPDAPMNGADLRELASAAPRPRDRAEGGADADS